MSDVPCNIPSVRPTVSMVDSAAQLYGRRGTILYLVTSQLKSGHRDKVLGQLWSLLDPMTFVGVYFVIFGVLFNQSPPGQAAQFILYLSIGVITWRFQSAVISQSANCIRGGRGLIHEISFPKSIFPVAICFARLYDFFWGLLVVAVLAMIFGSGLSVLWAWVLLLIVLQVLFTLGISWIVAYLGAFFADTLNVVDVALRLWFYLSPIFYYARGPNSRIPERFQPFYMLNPVACFLECYRDALMWGTSPSGQMVIYAACVSVITALVGFAVFIRGEGDYAKYV